MPISSIKKQSDEYDDNDSK